jgi:hypothetical protein
MRHYLHPRVMRRGNPVLMFISNDRSEATGKSRYELGVFHDIQPRLKPGPYSGEGTEYNASCAMRISKTLFDALKAEAKANYERYQPWP